MLSKKPTKPDRPTINIKHKNQETT